MKKELARSSAGSMLIKICQAVLGLITAMVLARSFGADSFGVYAYAVATATLLAVFSRFGFHAYVVYAINRAIAYDRRNEVPSILAAALLTASGLSLLAGMGLWLTAWLTPGWAMAPGLRYAALLVVAVALLQVTAGAVQAFGRVQMGLALEGVAKPVLFLLLVSVNLLVADPEQIGFAGLLVHYIVSEIVVILLALYFVLRWTRKEMGTLAVQPSLIRQHVSAARPYLMANAMIQLYQQAGMVAVGMAFAPAQAAMFRIAAQVAALIPFGLQALQSVMRPKIARMYPAGPEARRELQSMMTWSTRLLALVQSPVMVLAIFFPGFVLSLFGREFVAAAPMLVALAIGQSYSLLCGMNGDVLNMTGRAHITARWSSFALTLVLILLWPLMALWGAVGAAWAVSLSRIVWNTGLEFAAVKYAGLHTTILGVVGQRESLHSA